MRICKVGDNFGFIMTSVESFKLRVFFPQSTLYD